MRTKPPKHIKDIEYHIQFHRNPILKAAEEIQKEAIEIAAKALKKVVGYVKDASKQASDAEEKSVEISNLALEIIKQSAEDRKALQESDGRHISLRIYMIKNLSESAGRLYDLYRQIAKEKNNHTFKFAMEDVCKITGWGLYKYRNAKKELTKHKLIETIKKKRKSDKKYIYLIHVNDPVWLTETGDLLTKMSEKAHKMVNKSLKKARARFSSPQSVFCTKARARFSSPPSKFLLRKNITEKSHVVLSHTHGIDFSEKNKSKITPSHHTHHASHYTCCEQQFFQQHSQSSCEQHSHTTHSTDGKPSFTGQGLRVRSNTIKAKHIQLARDVKKYQLKNNNTPGKNHLIKKSSVKNGAAVLSQLERLDKWSWNEIKAVVMWGIRDNFWKDQILSCAGLRNKNNSGMPKFFNLRSSWARESEEGKVADKKTRKKLPNISEGLVKNILRYLELEETEENIQDVLYQIQSIEKHFNSLPDHIQERAGNSWVSIVMQYTRWLQGQNWAYKNKGLGYFSTNNNLWKQFAKSYYMQHNIQI